MIEESTINGASDRLPADVMGHMAGLGGTDRDHGICNSCLRALHYGVMVRAGATQALLNEAREALRPLKYISDRAMKADDALRTAQEQNKVVMEVGVQIALADFDEQIDPDYWLDPQERLIGATAFFHSRADHYVDPDDGTIKLESHEGDE